MLDQLKNLKQTLTEVQLLKEELYKSEKQIEELQKEMKEFKDEMVGFRVVLLDNVSFAFKELNKAAQTIKDIKDAERK